MALAKAGFALWLLLAAPFAAAQEGAQTAEPPQESTKALPFDCGDNRTILARKKAARIEPPKDVTDPDAWAEYERKVRERFHLAPTVSDEMALTEEEIEYIEGCALDEWSGALPPRSAARPENLAVLATGLVGDHAGNEAGQDDNDQSLAEGGDSEGKNRASSKLFGEYEILNRAAENQILRFVAGAVVIVLLGLLIRRVIWWVLGKIYRRRTCRIDAVLRNGTNEYDGRVLILGKRGCRFVADDWQKLHQLLESPEFLDFNVTIAGHNKPVFVSPSTESAVSLFFAHPLDRAEQNDMLALSTVTPQFIGWRPPKNSGRRGVKTVKARLARLQELREEEMSRKRTAG